MIQRKLWAHWPKMTSTKSEADDVLHICTEQIYWVSPQQFFLKIIEHIMILRDYRKEWASCNRSKPKQEQYIIWWYCVEASAGFRKENNNFACSWTFILSKVGRQKFRWSSLQRSRRNKYSSNSQHNAAEDQGLHISTTQKNRNLNADLVWVNELEPRLKASPDTYGTPKLWLPESVCRSGVFLKSKISPESSSLRTWFDCGRTLVVQNGSIKCSTPNLWKSLRKTLQKEKDLRETIINGAIKQWHEVLRRPETVPLSTETKRRWQANSHSGREKSQGTHCKRALSSKKVECTT